VPGRNFRHRGLIRISRSKRSANAGVPIIAEHSSRRLLTAGASNTGTLARICDTMVLFSFNEGGRTNIAISPLPALIKNPLFRYETTIPILFRRFSAHFSTTFFAFFAPFSPFCQK
jgi:hypothetical protein